MCVELQVKTHACKNTRVIFRKVVLVVITSSDLQNVWSVILIMYCDYHHLSPYSIISRHLFREREPHFLSNRWLPRESGPQGTLCSTGNKQVTEAVATISDTNTRCPESPWSYGFCSALTENQAACDNSSWLDGETLSKSQMQWQTQQASTLIMDIWTHSPTNTSAC